MSNGEYIMKIIAVSDLFRWKCEKRSFYIVDLRDISDYQNEHIHNAITYEVFKTLIDQNKIKKIPVVFYNNNGETPREISLDIKESFILKEGFTGWKKLCDKMKNKCYT